MEIQVSLSALPPSIYRKYRKGWKPNAALLSIFEKLSGKKGHKAMRIYIDAKSDNVIKNIAQNVKAPIQIVDALAEKNIVLIDYVAGTGKDTHGRVIKIGKALAKDPVLKKMFDSDPNRKALTNATRNHQLICISMHPYDIAGMSTDRGWVSCMHLKTGSNKQFVKQDIKAGTLIAYLIDPQDKNISKPIARCLAKPYFEQTRDKKKVVGGKVNALYIVDYAYPDSTMPFVHVLQSWLDEHVNPNLAVTERKGVYELQSKLYVDQRADIFEYDLESPMLRGDTAAFVKTLITRPAGNRTEPVALSYIERYPQIAIDLVQRKWGTTTFYARCARELSNQDFYTELSVFFKELFASFSLEDERVLKVWEGISGRPPAMNLFLGAIPNDERSAFVAKHLNEADLYANRDADFIDGSYPNALNQIWDIAKHSRNPERVFWYNASRINSSGIQTRYVEEEFKLGTRSYSRYLLAPAVGSLAIQNVPCPAATLDSLNRNKDSLPEGYYDYAKLVFSGYKFLNMNTGMAFQKILKEMLLARKFRKVETSSAVRRIDDDLCVSSAMSALFPDAITMTDEGLPTLIDSPMSVDQLRDELRQTVLELAMEDSIEEIKNIRAKRKEYLAKQKAMR